MTTSSSHVTRKPSGCSTENTRDLSILEVNRTELSVEEYSQLDTTSPLKDLDNHGEKITYFEIISKENTTSIQSKYSINEKFFRKFKEELNDKVVELFKDVRKGNVEETVKILKQYPIPVSTKETKYFKNTLLHEAIKYNQLEISLILLKMDISLLNQTNSEGRTPVHYALMYIKDLFEVILEDHVKDIDWSVLDINKIGYAEYVEFYQHNSETCRKVKQAVSKATSHLKKQEKPILPFFYKRALSQRPGIPQCSNPLRMAKSYQLNKSKRISQTNRISGFKNKESPFSLETNLSDFVVLKQLGEGCFAKVYKVQHIETKKIYAMKVFQKSNITHQIMKYIIVQKDLLMRLNHPFLVKAYCSFETSTLYCYVMDCCEGTLKDVLLSKKDISQNFIKLITCQLVSVLGYLHQNGVIYRDLKPQNIGFDKEGHVCLIDFGLAKDGFIGSSFCGSYLYLPPEMISARQYNQSVDWYMLGIVIYQLSSGKTPFLAIDKETLFEKITKQNADPLLGVSYEMSDFVSKLLEKNQMKRLGSDGDEEIMNHTWFNDIEWSSIPRRRYKIAFPSCQSQTNSINENAYVYFQNKAQAKSEYDFIEVKRWTSVKKLH